MSNDDANKSYDNVPQLAKSQAIVGGRLMYGNYKEGYENTDIDIDLNPVYYPDANFFKINVSHNGTTDAVVQSAIAPRFDFDFSELPDSLTTSHRVFLEFTIIPNKLFIFGSASGWKANELPWRTLEGSPNDN